MKKITDELLKTHQLIHKVLESLDPESPRFQPVMGTLHRTFLAHAYLQDQILAPALEGQSLIMAPLMGEIIREHRDVEFLIKTLLDTRLDSQAALATEVAKIRAAIDAHFKREENALYPFVERVLNPDSLHALAEEMERRHTEVPEAVAS